MHRRGASKGQGPAVPGPIPIGLPPLPIKDTAQKRKVPTNTVDSSKGVTDEMPNPLEAQLSPRGVVNLLPALQTPCMSAAVQEAEQLLHQLKDILDVESNSAPAQEVLLRDQVKELSEEVHELTESLKETSVDLIHATKAKQNAEIHNAQLLAENKELARQLRLASQRLQATSWFNKPANVQPSPFLMLPAAVYESAARKQQQQRGSIVSNCKQQCVRTCLSITWGLATSLFACVVLSCLALLVACTLDHPLAISSSANIADNVDANEACANAEVLLQSLHPVWSVTHFRAWHSQPDSLPASKLSRLVGVKQEVLQFILAPALVVCFAIMWIFSAIQKRTLVGWLPVIDKLSPQLAARSRRKARLIRMVCWTIVLATLLICATTFTWLIVVVDPGMCSNYGPGLLGALRCGTDACTTFTAMAIMLLVAAITIETGGFGYFSILNTLRASAVLDEDAEAFPHRSVYDPLQFTGDTLSLISSSFFAIITHAHAALFLISTFVLLAYFPSGNVLGPESVEGWSMDVLLYCVCYYLVCFRATVVAYEFIHITLARRAIAADKTQFIANVMFRTAGSAGEGEKDPEIVHVFNECDGEWQRRLHLLCSFIGGFSLLHTALCVYYVYAGGFDAALGWRVLDAFTRPPLLVISLTFVSLASWTV